MCGINGLYAFDPAAGPPDRAELLATRDRMQKRGPDGVGEWWSADRRMALGHRRLSIIDLSERASQPMSSADGALVVAFNGEIYNHEALRKELEREGCQFQTRSDTEVLLHLYAKQGREMVHSLRGMFAFALWDGRTRQLILARDPYGIKPLYYSLHQGTFRFASQVKALLAGGGAPADPDPAGIVGFHLWGCVPEPYTLYRGIRTLPAGHTLLVNEKGVGSPQAYASVAEVLALGSLAPASAEDLYPRVRTAALDSVRAHLVADVEVGVFLSAGIDSGAVLGLMRDAGQERVRALTLAFEEFRNTPEDESILAAQVARAYGAEHVIRQVSAAEFESDLPRILEAMDQPSIDGVNTWLVSKAAREAGLKVALSGVGGDELLAGYPSFRDIPRWVRWLRVPARWPTLGRAVRRALYQSPLAARRPKVAGLFEYGGTFPGAYLLRRALLLPFELPQLVDPQVLAEGLAALQPLQSIAASLPATFGGAISRVAALESTLYLRNQLLRDADWAGMDHSLEIRTPLVDFELLKQLASSVPNAGRGQGKHALASAPTRPLPQEVTHRPKTGFWVPTGAWAKGPVGTRPDTKGAGSRAWAAQVLEAVGAEPTSVAEP